MWIQVETPYSIFPQAKTCLIDQLNIEISFPRTLCCCRPVHREGSRPLLVKPTTRIVAHIIDILVEASETRGTTALVYCLINSSLYSGTVQGWWSTPQLVRRSVEVYSITLVQYLYVRCYLSDNKLVLSYLLSHLLPQWEPCGEPAISHNSHHVSLVQWTNPSLPVTRDLDSNPLGVLLWNRDSPVSVVSLHCGSKQDKRYDSTGLLSDK